jgi:hypothetical protein
VERFDYAVFTAGRYSHNAMLTREEAERLEREGLRCLDVETTEDDNLPRFRDRTYGWSRRSPRHWER